MSSVVLLLLPGAAATARTTSSTVPPNASASGFSPAQRGAGLSNQSISITGSGFTTGSNGTTVAFSGAGITINSYTRSSSTNMTINISIASDAPLGAQDVTFTNPSDAGTSMCTACFTVTGRTTVSFTTPTTLNGHIVVTFSQPVKNLRPNDNIYIRFSGHTYHLGIGSMTCAMQSSGGSNCYNGSLTTATIQPYYTLTAGQHYTMVVAPPGSSPITDFGGLAVAPASQDFRGGRFQQGENAIATVSTWRIVKNTASMDGSYTVDHLANSKASFFADGFAITWYTNFGPNYGLADVYIDGLFKAQINCYSVTTQYQVPVTMGGLAAHQHTFLIVVRGEKGSSGGTGTDVAVDGFKWARPNPLQHTTYYQTFPSPKGTYSWESVSAPLASRGVYIESDEGYSSSWFTFRGTAVEWDTVLGPEMGRAKVFIDGVQKASVDNYAASTQYFFARTFTGLTDQLHTIKIVLLGTHRSEATGSYVAIDRWVVT